MTDTAALVTSLRERGEQARGNRSGCSLVGYGFLLEAADAIESLNEQVLAGGWGGGSDTGVPQVTTLVPRTPLDEIEQRLAALEAAAAPPDDGACEECNRPGPSALRCGYCGGKVKP